jgi:ComF family protein
MPGRYSSQSSDTANIKAQVLPGLFTPIKRLFATGLELLFPPRCAGCGRVDVFWCERCQYEIAQMPLTPQVKPLPPLVAIASTGVHTGKLREAVQGLKYDNNQMLVQPLGSRLAARFTLLKWSVDMIVPVPLHMARLAERGYNQAQLVAEYLASQSGLRCEPAALERQRSTRSQVELGAAERLANLANAFRGDPALLTNQTILLIDDVYTTGATLSNCAQAALDAGANAVYGLTITAARSY